MSDARPTRPERPAVTALSTIAERLGIAPPEAEASVTGLTLSTQRVLQGDLYAALPGARVHGASFAAAAVAAGAVAVLTDEAGREQAGSAGVPVLVHPAPRSVLGDVAALVYGAPAEKLTLMGVTGTQGKTTTTRLLEAGLEAAGVPAAAIGTVGTRINGVEMKTALTTPEAPDLHGLFGLMVEQGVRGCAMEVSSHALVLGRVDGVVFDVAAFLNLGRDHLDFHTDLDDYFAAKASLFTPGRARRGLTNVDDEFGRRLLDRATVPMRTFSPSGGEADWRAVDQVRRRGGTDFSVITPDGSRLDAGVGIPGEFNVANALCAIAVAAEAGFDAAAVAAGIARSPGIPGRMETIDEGQDFLAVVDYAHKPDALDSVLAELALPGAGMVVVLGAGGDRDTGKRPAMGRIAARYATVLVVTDDNPRTEDPASIRAQILAGVEDAEPVHVPRVVVEIGDRAEAIRYAVAQAGPGDTVLVAGKGHETGQEVAGVITPFDDREQVRAALRESLKESPKERTPR